MTLSGLRCGACRATLTGGGLKYTKHGANLFGVSCPNCKRFNRLSYELAARLLYREPVRAEEAPKVATDNTKPKFKLGDWVQLVKDPHRAFRIIVVKTSESLLTNRTTFEYGLSGGLSFTEDRLTPFDSGEE